MMACRLRHVDVAVLHPFMYLMIMIAVDDDDDVQ